MAQPHHAPPVRPSPSRRRRTRKQHAWPWIVGGSAVLVVLITIATHDMNGNPPTAGRPGSVVTVVDDTKGTGSGSTPAFTTGAEWQVRYSYHCPGSGHFQLTSDDFHVDVDQLGPTGIATDRVHDDPGTHSLAVRSECDWTLTVLD